jgi:hypothetical protein
MRSVRRPEARPLQLERDAILLRRLPAAGVRRAQGEPLPGNGCGRDAAESRASSIGTAGAQSTTGSAAHVCARDKSSLTARQTQHGPGPGPQDDEALKGGSSRDEAGPAVCASHRLLREVVAPKCFYLSTDELRPLTRVRGDGHMRDRQRA